MTQHRKGRITGEPRGLVVGGNKHDGFRVWDDLGGHGPIVAGPFGTSAEAWRWVDRHQAEPLSKSEQRSDWMFRQLTGGSGL